MNITLAVLDFDGARTLWGRIFDVTYDDLDRLYDEAYGKRDGYHDAWYRVWEAAHRVDGYESSAGAAALSLLNGVGYSSVLGSSATFARLMRPTIGKPGGITQADYDLVSGPWRAVIGPVHEDDDYPGRVGA